MSKDYKRDEIIPLAEQIYIHASSDLIRMRYTDKAIKEHAKDTIRHAMLFREAEQELWEEEEIW